MDAGFYLSICKLLDPGMVSDYGPGDIQLFLKLMNDRLFCCFIHALFSFTAQYLQESTPHDPTIVQSFHKSTSHPKWGPLLLQTLCNYVGSVHSHGHERALPKA